MNITEKKQVEDLKYRLQLISRELKEDTDKKSNIKIAEAETLFTEHMKKLDMNVKVEKGVISATYKNLFINYRINNDSNINADVIIETDSDIYRIWIEEELDYIETESTPFEKDEIKKLNNSIKYFEERISKKDKISFHYRVSKVNKDNMAGAHRKDSVKYDNFKDFLVDEFK